MSSRRIEDLTPRMQERIRHFLVAFAEFVGGLLLIFGLLTRWTSVVLIIEMLVALFKVHLKQGFFISPPAYGYEFVLLILAVAALAIALARYRPNNKPFINMIEAGFIYLIQDKLYIWKRRKLTPKDLAKEKEMLRDESELVSREARLTGSKLRDLAWSLDVLDLKKESN